MNTMLANRITILSETEKIILLLEFDGYEKHKNIPNFYTNYKTRHSVDVTNFNYKSYNLLMPIAAKIVPPHGWVLDCMPYAERVMLACGRASLEAIFTSCVAFVCAYNKYELKRN